MGYYSDSDSDAAELDIPELPEWHLTENMQCGAPHLQHVIFAFFLGRLDEIV